MYRFPDPSRAIPPGDNRVVALSPLVAWKVVVVNDPFWPNTSSAVVSPGDPGVPGDVPACAGVKYSSTRLFPESDRNRSPLDSNVNPESNPTKQRLSAVGAAAPQLQALLVKLRSEKRRE